MKIKIQRDEGLLIAEYEGGMIKQLKQNILVALTFPESLDATSGMDIKGKKRVVADFNNDRIVHADGDVNKTFGKKGTEAGQFANPTDVQFSDNSIWVADAYNDRIQEFDMEGKHLQTIGVAENMNASIGFYVDDDRVSVTDFENRIVIIYNKKGKLIQLIDQNLDKPTDVVVINDKMYAVNFSGRFLPVFSRTEK